MNGVSEGSSSGGITGGLAATTTTSTENGGSSRTSPSMSVERERRLKARMAELADKSRAVASEDSAACGLGGGGGSSTTTASQVPAPAPRSLTTGLGVGGMTTTGGLPRYSTSGLDKGSYSSYRYTGFTSRLRSSYDQPGVTTTTSTSGATTALDSSSINASSLSTASSINATTATSPASALSSKRELFFRDGPTSLSSTTANGTTTTLRDQDDGPRLSTTTTTSIREKSSTSGSTSSSTANVAPNSKEVEGYVGFANLPNQGYRKAVKRGFEYTLMVVGESGLGKSTLINSMFLADIYSNEYPGPSLRVTKTVQVETTKVLLKESGVNLHLTVVDTPGFGDAVDNSNCWQPVMDYIENQYEEYLNAESRVNRRSMPDNRVHCCLYFIAPSGHGLKPLDLEFMKKLQDKVNIIPVIAKADTLTPEECALFKKTIMNEIAKNKLKIYEFPDCDDEEENKVQKPLKDRVPFAVVGSNVLIDNNGKKVRGRRYPWGIAEVENLDHCDFIALRNMVIRTHMQDLKDITNNVHYENYRCRRLAGVGNDGKPLRVSNKNPLAQMEEEKRDHEAKMKKMEQDMEQVFEMKVKEKKQKLKDSEAELQRRHEQMKKTLEQQLNELQEKRKAFEKEKLMWEDANKVTLDELRRRSLESNSKDSAASSTTSSTSSIEVVRKPSIVGKLKRQVEGKEKKKEKKKGLF